MHTNIHISSAQEMKNNITESIKTAYQSKPITIIVEETEESPLSETQNKYWI